MKNKISLIYKIVLSVAAIAFLITSIIFSFAMSDVSLGSFIDTDKAIKHADAIYSLNKKTDSEYKKKTSEYILQQIDNMGYTSNGKFKLAEQTFDVLYSGLNTAEMPYEGKNVIAEVNSLGGNGLSSEFVSLMLVDYGKLGGMNSAMIASMMQTLQYFETSNASFENKVVFAFVDGLEGARRLFSDYGQFANYKFVCSFEPLGVGEKIVVSKTGYTTGEFLSKLSSLSSVEISSAGQIENNNSLISAFGLNMPSVVFSTVENRYMHGTSMDNMSLVTDSLVNNISSVMIDISKTFGNTSLQRMHGFSTSNLYQSVFGSFIMQIPPVLLIILSVASMAVFIVVMIINVDLKVYDYKKLFIALGSCIAIAAVTLGITFLLCLLLTAFTVPIFSALFSNFGILLAFAGLAIGICFLLSRVAVKVFKLDSASMKISGVFATSLIGLIMTFIVPNYSYIFIIFSFICGVWFLLKMLAPSIFNKFSFILPAIVILIPVIVPFIYTLSITGGAGIYPYIIALLCFIIIPCIPSGIYKDVSFHVGKIKVSQLAPILLASFVAFFAFLLPSTIGGNALSINSNILNQQIEWYYDDAVVFVYDGQKSYAKVEDEQVYKHLSKKENFQKQDGKYTFDCNFAIDKNPTITISPISLSSGVKYEIDVKRAFSDSFYILRIPTFYADEVKLNLSIDGSDSMPYNLKGDFVEVLLFKDAVITATYSSDNVEFSNISYREITTSNEYVKNLQQYNNIDDILNLKIYTELNLAI